MDDEHDPIESTAVWAVIFLATLSTLIIDSFKFKETDLKRLFLLAGITNVSLF